jgi:hypothetical protein
MQPLHQGIIQTADECPRQRIPKGKTTRSAKYLAYIRRQPCLISGCRGKAEAAHTGRHGVGIKASDFDAVPLCTEHHTLSAHSYHALGERPFAKFWGLDLAATIERLNKKFGRKP